ncbi:MAG: cytochrome c3 family protein [Nitrospinota bacterium]
MLHPFTWVLLVVVALLAGPLLFLRGIRTLESYDPFCTYCHLADHQEYFDDGGRPPPQVETLSGWHTAKGEVGCIRCHGEDGLLGMARTTWLASGDLWRFIIGDYEQPSRVFRPILDKDCAKCHGADRVVSLAPERFHAITDHFLLETPCVQCHLSHRTGGRGKLAFFILERTRARCQECHEESIPPLAGLDGRGGEPFSGVATLPGTLREGALSLAPPAAFRQGRERPLRGGTPAPQLNIARSRASWTRAGR